MDSNPRKKNLPVFAILVWIYPVLAFGAANLGQANPFAVIRPILVSLVVGGIGYALFLLWLKSPLKAGILSLWCAILFSSYGHLYLRVENISLGHIILGRHRYLLLVWLLLLLAGVWLVRKLPVRSPRWNSILNSIAVVLIVLPVIQGIYYFSNQTTFQQGTQSNPQKTNPGIPQSQELPDIYYLVLDSYGRSDLLQNTYSYDNSGFIQFLKEKGFYIADCSQSNYNHTWFSISTAFNLDYLENLSYGGKPARPVTLIKHSLLRDTLSRLGYQMVAFETGYDFTDITDAEHYFHGNRSWDLESLLSAPVNAFELMYMRTTLASAIMELNGISEDQIENSVKKDMMEFIYTRLEDIPDIDGPKLVYAHINTTHPPFFYSFSDAQRQEENVRIPALVEMGAQTRLYRESIQYSDQKMEPIIDQILKKSKIPPIIIVQGDHGPFLSNTPEHIFDILNAYYFPDQQYELLYPGISPVNTFRVVLNQYFNGNYPTLPDVSYYSSARSTYDFTVVENHCK